MKHLTIAYIFLLGAIKTSAMIASLIDARSPISSTPKQFNIRSIGAHAVLFDKKGRQRLLNRLEDDPTALYRRSGRGGGQSPPRNNQSPARGRSQSPEIRGPGGLHTPLASAAGRGPARVTLIQDGRIGRPEVYQPGQPFERNVSGQRQAAAALETFGDSRATGISRSGNRATGVVNAIGQESAKLYVNASDGGYGRIHRLRPPPERIRWVNSGMTDTEEHIATSPSQRQELMASITGGAQALVEAKNPEPRGS